MLCLWTDRPYFDQHCPSVQCYSSAMNSGHFAQDCPNKTPPSRNTTPPQTGVTQGHDTPTPEGTDHNPLTIDTDIGDISTDHTHTTNSNATGAAADTEGTLCTSHRATAVAHATLQLTDAVITTCG